MANYDPQEKELIKKLDIRLIPFLVMTMTCFLLVSHQIFKKKERSAVLEVQFEDPALHITHDDIVMGSIFYGTGNIWLVTFRIYVLWALYYFYDQKIWPKSIHGNVIYFFSKLVHY